MFINQEFETPEAALEHYGVKGMRWGVRREHPSALVVTGWKTNRRPTTSEIKSARSRRNQIRDDIEALDKKHGKDPYTGKLRFTKAHEIAYTKLFEGDDRVIANHRTRGEKVVATLLAGPIGAYMTSDFRIRERMSNSLL